MIIGMVSDTFLPLIGGAEIHVNNLSRNLQTYGHDVKIFTNVKGNNSNNDFIVIRNYPPNLIFDSISLFNFIKSVDIVHCHYTYYLSSIACVIAKILGKPSVITLHGLGTLDSSVKHSIIKRLYRWISFKSADLIIGTSSEMVEVAKRFVRNEKIRLIPNAVNTEEFKPLSKSNNIKKKNLVVLSARRLNPKNGVQYLIDAIPFIIAETDLVEFWIMGEKKLESYLKKRVQNKGMEKYVKFIGEIPNKQMKYYYNLADILVFPSSAESTSIACLEAMAMEKVVVASSLGPYKVLLGDNERGVLVKLFDRESSDYEAPLILPTDRLKEISNAIVYLSKDEKVRKMFGKRARKFVKENYDWNIISNEIIQIYEELLDNI